MSLPNLPEQQLRYLAQVRRRQKPTTIGRIRFRKNNDQVIALIARREFHETSIGHFIVIQAVIVLPDESGLI